MIITSDAIGWQPPSPIRSHKRINMKKNKKGAEAPKITKPSGISTKGYAPSKSKAVSTAPEGTVARKPLDKRTVKIFSACVAAMVLIATVWLTAFFVLKAIDDNFDYIEYDLHKYMEFDREKYKNYSLNINIAKPHLKNEDGTGVSDVETEILYMIAAEKYGYVIDNGGMYPDATIAAGDEVYVWYRGYILDEDGKEQEVTSLTNFYQTSTYVTGSSNRLYVGLNAFPLKGFEMGFVGVNSANYAKFVKITDRPVAAGDVVYLQCERYEDGKTEDESEIGYCVRIDLTDEETAAIWSPILEGKNIGKIDDFDVTLNGKLYHYFDTEISFVTTCEKGAEKPVLQIETYAPYDYATEILQNETVYFDVYVERVVKHNTWHKTDGTTPYTFSMDWNDSYLENKLESGSLDLTREQLLTYEGESLTDKYESYVYSNLMKKYEEDLKVMTEDAMWDYYLSEVKVKKYPKSRVQKIYDEYYADIKYQFEKNGGKIYDMYSGQNVTCTDINQFGVLYFGLQYSENQDLNKVLREMAEGLVAERLILYYIMKEENLTPTESVFNARYEEIRQEYLDEFILQEGTDTSGYTEEEYEQYVENCKKSLFGYYDEEYFIETTYYDIILETLLTYPEIITMDDLPSYPQDK